VSLEVAPSSLWSVELEWPQETASLSEVWSNGEDFMNQIFNALNSVLSEGLFDDIVISDGDSLVVNLSVSSLVDQRFDGLEVGISEGDVRFNALQHVQSGSSQSNEDTIVDLSQSQKLQDLSWLRSQTVDTSNSDDKGELGFWFNKEVSSFLSLSSGSDEGSFSSSVFLDVLFGSLEDHLSVGFSGLSDGGLSFSKGLGLLSGGSSLLNEGFWNWSFGLFSRGWCSGLGWCSSLSWGSSFGWSLSRFRCHTD